MLSERERISSDLGVRSYEQEGAQHSGPWNQVCMNESGLICTVRH